MDNDIDHLGTIWEHIDAFRSTFIRSFIVVCAGFALALFFYQPILNFLTAQSFEKTPEGLSIRKIQRIQIVNSSGKPQIVELPASALIISETKSTAAGSHSYLLVPNETLIYEEAFLSGLLVMSPVEGLIIVFKTCFWIGLAITAPIWSWIWLNFIMPGLNRHEKVLIIPFLIGSMFCLILGIGAAYYGTLPIANSYLLQFNQTIGINAWTLTQYISYVLFLCLGHAIAAELSLSLFFLVHYGFITADWLIAKRRYMIVLSFILGAFLTPPDVLTQLILAMPLIVFYELAIQYAKWMEYKRKSLII